MAEYYAVLSKAVGGLESNSPDARRAVYDKARNALIGQLKAIDPPLPTAEISRQRLELEEAIRRVERETSAMPAGAPVKVAPSRAPAAPPPPPPPPSQPAAEAPAPAAASAPPPRQTPAPPRQSPADVFRRAIQDAEQREVTPGDQPRLERAAAGARSEANWGNARPERVERPAPPPPARTSESFTPAQAFSAEPPQPEPPRLAPDYEQTWQPDAHDTDEHDEPVMRAEVRDRPLPPKGKRRGQGPRRPPPRAEEDFHDGEIEQEARPSRLPAIVLSVLILAMVVALGALGWSFRDQLADVLNSFDGPSEPVTQVAAPAQEATSNKDNASLLGGDAPAAATDEANVRVVAPDDAAGTAATPALSLQDPAADAGAAAPALDADALVAQRAALYEEPTQEGGEVVPVNAAVTWSFVENGPNGPEIVGNVDVPDRSMSFRITVRRNIDESLPASHIVEINVQTPEGETVRDIPRIVFKQTEDGRGQQLIGAPAQVADGFFWIALSNAAPDVQANLNLLTSQMWIDLPFIYGNGRRAILTFEKGTPGERVFARAVSAWAG